MPETTLAVIAAVPEPGNWAGFSLGLVALVGLAKRRGGKP